MLTHLTQDRIRVGLFRLAALTERYQGTTRRIIPSMIVPDMCNTLTIPDTTAYKLLRQARDAGYIEDDTDIETGANPRSKPIHITRKGIALLGNWHDAAIREGRTARQKDDAVPPPGTDQKAG